MVLALLAVTTMAALVGAGPGTGAAPSLAPDQTTADSQPVAAPAAMPPNILLIVADDQARSLFNRSIMPTVFSALVDQGTLFNRFYVSTSLCCPSRSQMLTGLYEHHTRVDQNTVRLARTRASTRPST